MPTFYNGNAASKACNINLNSSIKEELSVFNQTNSVQKESDTPYFSNKASMSLAGVSEFGSRNVINSYIECQQPMDQTACFKCESIKQTCVSQCDRDDDCQIVTESLDTDTTSLLIGSGLSCS